MYVKISQFLLIALAGVTASSCSDLQTCYSIGLSSECGWCWDSSLTVGQQHGARAGTSSGPSDGECNDWTYHFYDCQSHTDCPVLPDCLNILGTDCGWCADTQSAMKGTSFGPTSGTCKSSWIWDHADCPVQKGPQQIHLSLTNNITSMMATWTQQTDSNSSLTFWPTESTTQITHVKADASHFGADDANPDGTQWVFRAVMSGLKPGSSYTYYVASGDGTIKSEQFSYTVMPDGSNWEGKFLVFGDMGKYGGGDVLHDLQREVLEQHREFHSIIHLGDFAYDLHDAGGINGDNFFNRIQSMAARIPYITTVGNHEDAYNFSHYRRRFSQPRYDVNDGMDMWWSADVGLVHFISYSSEVFFTNNGSDVQRQADWLKQDLEKANQNRHQQPWIIAMGHRPMYCSNNDGDDCTKESSLARAGLEDLFHQGGVDIVFEAHEHSYERLWPVYNDVVTQKDYNNPKAMVHLISGAAGCNEDSGLCINLILGPRGPWSAFRASLPGTYSYGHLNVVNTTHVYWESIMAEPEKVDDKIWIVQNSHGPRE